MNDTIPLDPKQGVNVRIRHRPLHVEKRYPSAPLPIQDLAAGRLMSALQAVLKLQRGGCTLREIRRSSY